MPAEDPEREYVRRTPVSAQRHQTATEYLPDGDSRAATYHEPYPSFATSASGCTITTVDDKQLLDFHNDYTQTVLGHVSDGVVEAVME